MSFALSLSRLECQSNVRSLVTATQTTIMKPPSASRVKQGGTGVPHTVVPSSTRQTAKSGCYYFGLVTQENLYLNI